MNALKYGLKSTGSIVINQEKCAFIASGVDQLKEKIYGWYEYKYEARTLLLPDHNHSSQHYGEKAMTSRRLKTILKIPTLLITLLFFFGAAIFSPGSRLQADEDEEPAESFYKQDINKDGSANIVDVVALLLLGKDDPENPVADYTDDDKCDISDVISLLLNIMKGDLTELEAFPLTGRVVVNDQGVEGVVILLESSAGWGQTTTDADGVYSFDVYDGMYGVKPIIRNWSYTFDPEEMEVRVNGNSITVPDIAATLASFTLSGRVLEDSIGLADVSVSVKGEGGIDTTLVTDSDGMYCIQGLLNAPYTVVPQKENYIFSPYSMALKMDGDTTAPDIQAALAGPTPVEVYMIEGMVYCTVAPLSNVQVLLMGDMEASTVTDGNGLYTFAVPNGKYLIIGVPIPMYQVFNPISHEVIVNDQDVLNINFFGYGAGGIGE